MMVDLISANFILSATNRFVFVLQNWELLVLSKLEWKMGAITGFDFVDQIIERCSWKNENVLLRRHAHTLVSVASTGRNLLFK